MDFVKIVKTKDEEMSEEGGYCDAQDIYDELVLKYGERYSKSIKSAVEEFYGITLE